MQQPLRTRLAALFGLTMAVALPELGLGGRIAPGESISASLIHEALWWSYAAAVLLWLRFAEGLPLSSIGLRRLTGRCVLVGVLAAAALLLVFVIHSTLIVPMFHLDTGAAGAERNLILAKPYWYRVLLVLRAAVVEEILFRGYLIEKVRQLTGSAALAVAFSVVTFTYAHLSSSGLVHLILVFAGGVIFALLYVSARSRFEHDRALHLRRGGLPDLSDRLPFPVCQSGN